jgi:hypothetical protein
MTGYDADGDAVTKLAIENTSPAHYILRLSIDDTGGKLFKYVSLKELPISKTWAPYIVRPGETKIVKSTFGFPTIHTYPFCPFLHLFTPYVDIHANGHSTLVP